jgi:hypothetical protein
VRPYAEDVVNVRTQVRGYEDAVGRFRQAASDRDGVGAYRPLFEALSWAASIDHRIGRIWAPDGVLLRERWPSKAPNADVVPALRFARNTVHHDWADALVLDADGRRYDSRSPRRYFEWIWRDTDALPASRRRKGRDEYGKVLSGRPAEPTLLTLGETFDFVAELLEPRVGRNAVMQ